MIAHFVANKNGAIFCLISGPEIMTKMAGESETNLRKQKRILLLFLLMELILSRDKTNGEVERRVVS